MRNVTWTVEGRGISTYHITATDEQVWKMLEKAPKTKKKVEKWLEENDETDPCAATIESGPWPYDGLAARMRDAILEVENVELAAAEDEDGEQFLVYTRLYPWEEEKAKTKRFKDKKSLDALYRKWVRMLTDKKILIQEQSVECGGY